MEETNMKLQMKKMNFRLEINRISQLGQDFSKEFTFRDLKWKILLRKMAPSMENDMKTSVGIYIGSGDVSELKNHMCGVRSRISLLKAANIIGVTSFVCQVYKSNCSSWGRPCFIEWRKLFEDGYVRHDTVFLDVEIEVGPLELESLNNFNLVELTANLWKLTLNTISDFVATESTSFKFHNCLWSIKAFKVNYGIISEEYLRIGLICRNDGQDWLIKVKTTLKLVAMKNDCEPIETKLNATFSKRDELEYIYVVKWSELNNKFVKDDSIEMMFEMELDEKEETSSESETSEPETSEAAAKKSIFVECAICMENMIEKEISETPCGHLFCTKCIEESIEANPVCPLCNAAVAVDELHRSFLPK